MFQRTPPRITPEIQKFSDTLVKHSRPEYLIVETKSHCIPLYCYQNVDMQIKIEGGNVQYGWQIWEWPGIMIQGEFHAVWRDGEDNLHDITPKQVDRIKNILFVPDNFQTYKGRQIDNVRMALNNDPLIKEFIDIEHQIFLETNPDSPYLILTPKLNNLMIRGTQLEAEISLKYPLLENL